MQPSRAVDLHFFKPSKKRSNKEEEKSVHAEAKRRRLTYPEPKPKLSPSEVYSELFKSSPNAVVYSVIPGFVQPCRQNQMLRECIRVEPNLPVPLHKLYSPENRSLDDDELRQKCLEAFGKIAITDDEGEFLKQATIRQSQSTTWFDHRKGRITASNFYDVVRHVTNGRSYPNSIVKRIMQYYSSNARVEALEWGREKEDTARQEYLSIIEGSHQNLTVSQCGLVVSPAHPYLGASPDGLVSCRCCGDGVLEIKCPYKYRSQSPIDEEPLSDKEYCLTKSPSTGAVSLSSGHKYNYQVQGQIALCKVDYCDFVCWTEKGAFVERIKRDDALINTMIPQLKSFFIDILLPELLTMNLCRPPTPESTTENETLKLFCVCRKPEYGDMIACDNPSCPTPDEWYHYKCVNIKSTPRKWYCLHCKN